MLYWLWVHNHNSAAHCCIPACCRAIDTGDSRSEVISWIKWLEMHQNDHATNISGDRNEIDQAQLHHGLGFHILVFGILQSWIPSNEKMSQIEFYLLKPTFVHQFISSNKAPSLISLCHRLLVFFERWTRIFNTSTEEGWGGVASEGPIFIVDI